MKNTYYLTLPLLVLSLVSCKKNTWTDDSPVIRFQDEKFLQAILENPRNTVDKNNDGQITEKEARTATVLDVRFAGISSMEEIEYFTSLTELYCWGNQLTAIDVSRNTLLEIFDCSFNSIASLDVGSNTVLEDFDCSYNQIASLDIGRNASLQVLHCNNNLLEYVDVSACPALTILNINSNRISEINFYENTALVELYCDDNLLTSLDLRYNKELEYLSCSQNQLSRVILYRHHKLSDANVAEIREEYGDIIEYEFAMGG